MSCWRSGWEQPPVWQDLPLDLSERLTPPHPPRHLGWQRPHAFSAYLQTDA